MHLKKRGACGKPAFDLTSGQRLKTPRKCSKQKRPLPERVGAVPNETCDEFANGPKVGHQAWIVFRIVPTDAVDGGRMRFEQVRIQKHEAAGFRTREGGRAVDKLVDYERVARKGGTSLGEIVLAGLHLNLTETFGAVKRTLCCWKQLDAREGKRKEVFLIPTLSPEKVKGWDTGAL
jgi:hypothetical protein